MLSCRAESKQECWGSFCCYISKIWCSLSNCFLTINWLYITTHCDIVWNLIWQGPPLIIMALLSLASQKKKIFCLPWLPLFRLNIVFPFRAQDSPSFFIRSSVVLPFTTIELSSSTLNEQSSFIRKSLKNSTKSSEESTPSCGTPMIAEKVWDVSLLDSKKNLSQESFQSLNHSTCYVVVP